jgi:starch-binding outer membrane protein, SusD/RagB family
MKRNINYLFRCSSLLALIVLAHACKKLDERPISSVTPENFGNSVLQIEAAYAGSMNYLWDYWSGYGYAYYPFSNDDQLNGGDLNIAPDNADDLWNRHYKALLNINAALGSIKKGNIKGESQETVDALEAQGKFLRAHNYFMLVRMFGGVPLITEDTPDPILNPMARASAAEVYDLITSDLIFSASKLPESWSDAPGKPTSGAAKSMLAKVYLTMATYPLNETSNYQKAADMALQVIESSAYSLIDSVVDVFSLANKYGPENIWSYNSTYDDIATDPEIWTTGNYLDGGWGDAAVDTAFERMWPDQKRKEAYLFTDWDGTHYTDFPEQTPFCKKFFFYISADDFNGYSSTMNYPILRFADVLMIYAEAANMASAGSTAPQDAVDKINMVIDRANGFKPNPDHPLLTTSMTKAEFDAAIIQERNWELVFENCDRWFDICRKRILDDPKVTVRAEDRVNFSIDDYLFPIPETDLRLNKLLEQNPGYPTPDR